MHWCLWDGEGIAIGIGINGILNFIGGYSYRLVLILVLIFVNYLLHRISFENGISGYS